jgi:hypothetical protein
VTRASNDEREKCDGIPKDSLITAAARALAAGDPSAPCPAGSPWPVSSTDGSSPLVSPRSTVGISRMTQRIALREDAPR